MAVIIADGVAAGAPSAYALTDFATMRAAPWSLAVADISDVALAFLINAVTDIIERECDHHIVARDYTGWHDGNGARCLELPEWPLNSVSRVNIGILDALNVQCNDPLATEAYAEVNKAGTLLHLTILDGANAGTTDLSFAGHTTLTAMATAINAAVGSWTGTALGGYGGYRSNTLRPCGRRECYGSTATFQIPDEGESDYRTDYEYGQIILHGAFGHGYRNVHVEYNAGWTVIPPALHLLASEMVKLAFDNGKRDASLKSETLGDYSWTAGEILSAIDLKNANIQRRLAPFMNNPI